MDYFYDTFMLHFFLSFLEFAIINHFPHFFYVIEQLRKNISFCVSQKKENTRLELEMGILGHFLHKLFNISHHTWCYL